MSETKYAITEVFLSLQGEGVRSGVPSVFVRFAGCNLDCNVAEHGFDCDTDFKARSSMTESQLVVAVLAVSRGCKWVIFTGGEPGIQLNEDLVAAFKAKGFKLAIETNGMYELPEGLDWICVSPKVEDSQIKVRKADEVKFVVKDGDPIPTTGIDATHYVLSPAWGVASKTDIQNPGALDPHNAAHARMLCLSHPHWRYSEQKHKHWQVQ